MLILATKGAKTRHKVYHYGPCSGQMSHNKILSEKPEQSQEKSPDFTEDQEIFGESGHFRCPNAEKANHPKQPFLMTYYMVRVFPFF